MLLSQSFDYILHLKYFVHIYITYKNCSFETIVKSLIMHILLNDFKKTLKILEIVSNVRKIF